MKPEIYTGLKWGALFGGPLAIFETFLYLLAFQERNAANLQLADCILIPLEAILPFVAGFIAGRQTMSVRSGLIAGLTCGLIVAAVNMTSEIVYPLPPEFLNPEGIELSTAEMVFGTIITRVMTIAFGAGFGWLGAQQAIRLTPPPDGRGR